MTIAIIATGDPQTKGSAKAFKHRTTGKIIVRNDNPKCKAWAEAIAWQARAAMGPRKPIVGLVRVVADFKLTKPRTSKLAAPALDVDKLLRAALDALTGVVFVDDRQVVEAVARKAWATGKPGVTLRIEEAPTETLAELAARLSAIGAAS